MCAVFCYKKTGTVTGSYDIRNEQTWLKVVKVLFHSIFLVIFHKHSTRNFKSLKLIFLDQFWITTSKVWAWIGNFK